MDEIKNYTADEIAALTPEALAELETSLTEQWDTVIKTEAPSADDVARATAVANARDLIVADKTRRDTEAQEAADAFAELKDRKFEPVEAEPEPEPVDEVVEPEPVEPVEPVEDITPVEPVAAEPVAAATKTSSTTTKARSAVAALANRNGRPKAPEAGKHFTDRRPLTITAAAEASGLTAGTKVDLSQVGQAVLDRVGSFSAPSGNGEGENLQHFGTAKFETYFPPELMIDGLENSEQAEKAIALATDMTQLPGGSLTAAGWCAPSETVYDLDQDATTAGMLSLPEVGVRRGGMRWPVRPEFADFYANPGFKQTEAQAIAGTTKTCVTIPCPSFAEARLDVDGVCIKVDILAEVGYPENVANYVAGTLIAHEHWINADIIGRVVTASGTVRTFAGLGSVYSDSLEALGLVIDQRRQKHRLAFDHPMEVLLPFWVENVLKNDLGRRMGRNGGVASDQELNAAFSAMGAVVQYLYDWQLLDEDAEIYPTTFRAVVYPAGTFVKGTSPVIKLDTIYDAASLAVNTYTGLFTEQAYLVAKKKLGSDYVSIPICAAGRTGAANFTCA